MYFANEYGYELYDNLRGWASNVDNDYPPHPPLTNTQIRKLKENFSYINQVFRNGTWKSNLSGIYLTIDLLKQTIKELD